MIFKLDFQDSFRNSCDVFVFFLLSIYRAQVNQSYKSWMRIVVVYQLIRLVKRLKDVIITVNYQVLKQTKLILDFPITPTVMSVLFCTDPLYQPQHLRPPLVSPHILNPLVSFAAVHLPAKYLC